MVDDFSNRSLLRTTAITRQQRLAATIRAGDWWDFKVLPILTVFAATALTLGGPIAPQWPTALLLLVSLTIGAVFASLINDLFDRTEDRLAGKPNATARYPRSMIAAVLIALAASGSFFAWIWRETPALVGVYVAAWLAFVAYSMPPLRLKARGGWGVAAMGLGEATLPSLVAAMIALRAGGSAGSALWIVAVSAWSLGHGMRAILWHQLGDSEADAAASVSTLVRRRGADWVRRLAAWGLLPIEVAGLGVILAMMHSPLPWLALALYLGVLWVRARLWSNIVVIVAPVPRHLLILQDYYIGYLPLAIIVASALRHPVDLVLLPALLLLFPNAMIRIIGDTLRLTWRVGAALI